MCMAFRDLSDPDEMQLNPNLAEQLTVDATFAAHAVNQGAIESSRGGVIRVGEKKLKWLAVSGESAWDELKGLFSRNYKAEIVIITLQKAKSSLFPIDFARKVDGVFFDEVHRLQGDLVVSASQLLSHIRCVRDPGRGVLNVTLATATMPGIQSFAAEFAGVAAESVRHIRRFVISKGQLLKRSGSIIRMLAKIKGMFPLSFLANV
jgi:hypothetical protein